MTRRLTTAALGIFTAPIVFLAWPFFLAWYVFNESEGYDL